MARLSYGGDMFSPIRHDNSFNEDSFLGGRNSDVMFGTWKDLFSESNNKDGKKDKERSVCKEAANTREDKPTKGKQTKSMNRNLSPEEKSSENLVDNSYLKSVSQEVSVSKKKVSHITTRKSSLQNAKKTNGSHEETVLGKKTNDKQKLSKHVTMRSSTRKKSTHLAEDLKQHNKFSSASFPTLDEENIEKSVDSTITHKDNMHEYSTVLSRSQTGCEPLSFQLGQNFTGLADSTKEIKETQTAICKEDISFNSNHDKSEVTPSTINCENHTDLLMSELNPVINKASTEKQNLKSCINQGSNLFSSQYSNQSQQIQVGIIEKLVKDTVSFEFDSIRQMLYLHQLSLFKHLDRNAENMKQNSFDCDILLKIIDELMEENKQLRKIIATQNVGR